MRVLRGSVDSAGCGIRGSRLMTDNVFIILNVLYTKVHEKETHFIWVIVGCNKSWAGFVLHTKTKRAAVPSFICGSLLTVIYTDFASQQRYESAMLA